MYYKVIDMSKLWFLKDKNNFYSYLHNVTTFLKARVFFFYQNCLLHC